MILDDETIIGLGAIMSIPPLDGPIELVHAIWDIINEGNSKHANDKPNAIEHVEHAIRHLQFGGNDRDSGQPARAHAAARLLLALLDITKGGAN